MSAFFPKLFRHAVRELFVFGLAFQAVTGLAELATGRRGIVATGHPLATQAALDAFRRGGNAIDGAVAAGLMLGVVDSPNSGIGGSCVMTIRLANGRFICIDGIGMAPSMATRERFMHDGHQESYRLREGPSSVAVPGALAAYEYAARQLGRLPLREHLLMGAKVAEEGFKIDSAFVQKLNIAAKDLRDYLPGTRAFFQPDRQAKRVGEVLQQPDLARTYRMIAQEGKPWFYNGPFNTALSEWMLNRDGLIFNTDLPLYQIRLRDPVLTTYRGYSVAGFPPPSSGGVLVGEILNILENFNLKAMGTNSAATIHVVAEAMKLAFADRVQWLGDPDFAKVPRGLISKSYAAQLAERISTNRVITVPHGSLPPAATQDYFRQHTTHFSTADAQGNWVACTASLETSFGSKIVVPGTGVLLNNEMNGFSAQPGALDYFGMPGSEATTVAPRKRPLSNMSPTLVLRNNRPVMALGGAGGPTIISQIVLAIINVIDFGMDVETALQQPRFHQQWNPDELKIESVIGPAVIEELTRRGHQVTPVESLGVTQIVAIGAKGQGFVGANDPRVEGMAAGF